MIPVIMSGGSGTRLWPLSRKNKPKQFLSLHGENTLFQETLLRLNDVEDIAAPIIVSNKSHRFMVAEQLHEINSEQATILLEPCARNTAPALALAALQAIESSSADDDPLLLVLAADHVILDQDKFHQALNSARDRANAGEMVTFGIVPTDANTGYGYIEAEHKDEISAVVAFVEKPDLATAQNYVSSGNYFWNSGMFMFKASTLLQELEAFSPDILTACKQALSLAKQDMDFIRVDNDAFEQCPSDSIDYAVMEHTHKAVVVPLDAGWTDVGTWSSLWQACEQDDDGNVLRGDVYTDGVKDAYIHSEHRLVSVLGLENIVVVETADAVMIDRAQNIKTIVSRLGEDGRDETDNHRVCYRPWGHYDGIDKDENFQVKRITVNPGGSLSLQKHHHRAEHWVVVTGTAEVTLGDELLVLVENDSVHIPIGTLHRLHNPGRLPLVIIEVQTGHYLGEDDIVRVEDHYNRIENA